MPSAVASLLVIDKARWPVQKVEEVAQRLLAPPVKELPDGTRPAGYRGFAVFNGHQADYRRWVSDELRQRKANCLLELTSVEPTANDRDIADYSIFSDTVDWSLKYPQYEHDLHDSLNIFRRSLVDCLLPSRFRLLPDLRNPVVPLNVQLEAVAPAERLESLSMPSYDSKSVYLVPVQLAKILRETHTSSSRGSPFANRSRRRVA